MVLAKSILAFITLGYQLDWLLEGIQMRKKQCLRVNTGEEIVLLPRRFDVKRIYIEVTTRCNFNCTTCIRHSWRDEDAMLSWDDFLRIADQLHEFPNLQSVHFGGFGEPLLHPRFADMIKTLHQAGYQTEVISNGSFLTPTMCTMLMDAGLDWLFVSLDGSDQDSYETMRPGADYTSVVNNLLWIRNEKKKRSTQVPFIGIEFVATKKNFLHLSQLRRVCDHLEANKLVVTHVLPYHESMKDEILYDQEHCLEEFGADAPLLSVRAGIPLALRTERKCRFIEGKSLVITASGKVAPCYSFMHEYDCFVRGRKKRMQPCHFGDIRQETLGDIWTKEEYVRFRWAVRNSKFPSCIDCQQADGCVYLQDNQGDCWGNEPSCGDCLWARELIVCP